MFWCKKYLLEKIVRPNNNYFSKKWLEMILFSEIITTFVSELERHEKTCCGEGSHDIERFDIIQGLKCGSFKTCLDNGNSAHAVGLLYPFLKGRIYLIAWAIASLPTSGSFHNLSPGI